MNSQAPTKLSSTSTFSIPYGECVCLTCNRWTGSRRIDLTGPVMFATCEGDTEGNCVDGAWMGLGALAHQRCNEYQQWDALKIGFGFNLRLSSIWGSQSFLGHLRHFRQRILGNPAAPTCSTRLDSALNSIDQFMIRDAWMENPPLLTCMKFATWTIFLNPLFNAFYWLGLSARKPLSELTGEDIDCSVN